MAYQDEITHMERGELEALQLERMKETLVNCYENIEFYKNSFDEAGFDPARLAAILVPVIFLWVSEAIPIGITALLATASMIAFKVTSAQAGWAPYANRAVMFVMMIIMFGVVLNEVGLAKRLLFWILKFAGTNVKKLSFFIAFTCTMLATIFHDATVTIIMLFAILPIFAARA